MIENFYDLTKLGAAIFFLNFTFREEFVSEKDKNFRMERSNLKLLCRVKNFFDNIEKMCAS